MSYEVYIDNASTQISRALESRNDMLEESKSVVELGVIGTRLWSSDDNKSYFAVSDTCKELPPDVYEARISNSTGQPYFYRVNYSTNEILRFEDSVIDKIVSEIESFWLKKEKFKEFGLPFRRGLLLYGPPGSGKSCTLKLIIQHVIKLNGIAVKMQDPTSFIECMRIFRRIQPNTPVVCIMEDIDGMLSGSHEARESLILNLLDGVDGFENIIFLATTNYPERLEGRVSNRPSRFDRRYSVGYPSDKSRRMYLEHLISKVPSEELSDLVDIDRWVKDTDKFTPAHLKELFISVVMFDNDYKEALTTLTEMMSKKISVDEHSGKVGFGR